MSVGTQTGTRPRWERGRSRGSALSPTLSRRVRAVAAGPAGEPAWARPSLWGLLVLTAVLYLWSLGASGYANAFYSAAVQAGTKSWSAFFFGSLDAANSISVDKPPASLWVMDLSARLFGVNSWSILVPQALEGVATVAFLYAAVRRVVGPAGGLVAGAVMATTPVAALMFRFNNPDALLVLLVVAAAWAVTVAVDTGSTRWLLLAGTLVGFGFLTKMLQALVVLPAFGLAYLVAGPTPVRRRLLQLLAAGAAVVVSAGWWVAIVSLVPASARPYIGGSTDNSVLQLAFGYNGLGRITGNETGSVGGAPPGAPGGASMWGPTGITRLFNESFGSDIAWLLPTALLALAAITVVALRAPRTDPLRAATILWGGWLLITGLTFSLAQGIIHPYYTVALAPAIGALVGLAAVALWRRRSSLAARLCLCAGIAGAVAEAVVLLDRSPAWNPWLRVVLPAAGGLAVLAALIAPVVPRRLLAAAGVAAAVAVLGGPAAYAVDTAATPHQGAIPSAGPAITTGTGPGRLGGPGGPFGPGAPGAPAGPGGPGGPIGVPLGGGTPGGGAASGFPGGAPPAGGAPTAPFPGAADGAAGGRGRGPGGFGGVAAGGPRGGPGGLLDGGTPDPALVALLSADSSRYTWVAATVGANNSASLQLATGDPVMAIGGFNGTDPSPTLDGFQALVAAGRIHYFVGGGGFGPGQNARTASASQQISTWVAQHYTATTVGGQTVHDLTAPAGGAF